MINPMLIKYSLQSIYKRRTRSWLTVVSVLIGIAAVTTLISFGYGLSFYVSDMSQKMGTDKLIIAARGIGPGGVSVSSSIKLNKSDVDVVRKTNGVEEVVGMYLISAEVEFNKEKKYAFALGMDFKEHRKVIEELMTVSIISGAALSGDEKSKGIFGYNYMLPEKIFKKAVKLGDKIKINGQYITVAAFYDSIGNPQDDSNIYLTEAAAEELLGAENYNEIFVRASPGENTTQLADDITKELRRHRNQKKGQEDFFVQTFEQVIQTFTAILNIIIIVVILIAGISVLVASVNIMNTMYASILERTKEIGVMKAIGARNSEILMIFITESGILSLIGGIIGVMIGLVISKAAGSIIAAAGYGFFKPFFSLEMVFWILTFSFLVGIFAGFLPSHKASKLSPVEALRYE